MIPDGTRIRSIENPSGVTCDRCKHFPAALAITYPPPADWRRLLCEGCWEATQDLDPLAMIRNGDGSR